MELSFSVLELSLYKQLWYLTCSFFQVTAITSFIGSQEINWPAAKNSCVSGANNLEPVLSEVIDGRRQH